jgi:uncharacterized SAM-binding protein YcdF (DUF218 family)
MVNELQRLVLSLVLSPAGGPALSPAKGLSKGCLIVGVALLSTMLLVCGIAAMSVGKFLVLTDSLAPVDAIVVLSGDSPDFARAQWAVRLFHQGYAPTVVFIGRSLNDVGSPCSKVQQSLEAAQRQGLPDDAAIITYGPGSTYDEAVNLRRLVQEYNWRSLIIVTDPFHTRRAGRTFRTVLSDVTIYVSATSYSNYDSGHWWQTEDSLVAVFSEVIKLAFYWAKYGIAPIEL